jgi:hypothetical protein
MQARQLGLAGRSRMRKDELAYAVSRERRRPAATSAAARVCRAQFAKLAVGAPACRAAIRAFLRRLNSNRRTNGWTAAMTVATFRRARWLERIVLPLAAVALAGVFGAAMPLLIAGGPAEGVAVANAAAAIPASQSPSGTAGSDRQRAVADGPTRGHSSDTRQRSTPFASGGASPTGIRSAAVVAQEEDSNAVDQPSQVQAPSEPSASPEPHASPGGEADAEEPSSEPTAGPMPSADEDEQEEEAVTLCHKAGSKKPKTISVGEDAVEAHLAHGDTIGACP